MSEIVERLEKLTGPDPAVDEAIHVNVSGVTAEWQEYKQANAYHKDGSWVSIGPIPPYTASVDAAVALVEKVLPGWARYVEYIDGIDPKFKEHPAQADLWLIPARSQGRKVERFRASAPTEPLALLLALFRALAQGE